jgi:hypothetical protein
MNQQPIALPITTEELEIFEGHNQATSEAFENWAKDHRYYCHFTLMEITEGLNGETLFECKHCGHTVDTDGIKVEV